MELEETLDTGGIYRCVEIPIGPNQTLEELRAKSVSEGVDLLLQSLEEGLGSPTPQLGEPSYAHKISGSELEIDWGLSSEEILRLVRLGRAWTTVSGSRLRIHSAKIGSLTNLEIGQRKGLSVGSCDGTVELLEVQPEGRKKMLAEDWMNGLSEKTNGYLGNG